MLIYSDKYRGWGKQKPRQWGPISAVKSGVRSYYEDTLNISAPKMFIPFWEGSGSAQDISGGRASLSGNTVWTRKSGKSGIYTDASSDVVICSDTNYLAANTAFTTYVLCNCNETSTTRKRAIRFADVAIGSANFVDFGDGTTKYISGGIRYGTSTYETAVHSTFEPTANKDYFIALRWKPGFTVSLTVDNLTVASATARTTCAAGELIYVGNSGSGFPFKGVVFFAGAHQEYLSLDTLNAISNNPYAAIQPRIAPVYFFPAAGGETTGSFAVSISMASACSGKIGVGGGLSTSAGNTIMANTAQEGKQGLFSADLLSSLLLSGALGVNSNIATTLANILSSISGQEGKTGSLLSSTTSFPFVSQGQLGQNAAIESSVLVSLGVLGKEGKQGTLSSQISLAAIFSAIFSEEDHPVFSGAITAIAGEIEASILGNCGVKASIIAEVIAAAALVGKLGSSGSYSIPMDGLTGVLNGAIGVNAVISTTISSGMSLAGKLGISGAIIAAIEDFDLRLIEIATSTKIYQVILSMRTGQAVLVTRSGSGTITTV